MKKLITLASLEISLHNKDLAEYSKYAHWKVKRIARPDPNSASFMRKRWGILESKTAAEKREYLIAKLDEIGGKVVTLNVVT